MLKKLKSNPLVYQLRSTAYVRTGNQLKLTKNFPNFYFGSTASYASRGCASQTERTRWNVPPATTRRSLGTHLWRVAPLAHAPCCAASHWLWATKTRPVYCRSHLRMILEEGLYPSGRVGSARVRRDRTQVSWPLRDRRLGSSRSSSTRASSSSSSNVELRISYSARSSNGAT